MDYDYKQLLSLLAGHRSEETRRAHRNVSVTSFIIVAAKLVGVQLSKVNAFGISPFKGSELVVLGIATVLLCYWLAMFLIHWNHDQEIQKERATILDEYMKPILERHAYLKKKMEDKNYLPGDWQEIKRAVKAYELQQLRTKRAALFQSIAGKTELVVPLALATFAFIALGHWFYSCAVAGGCAIS